jgi:guanylate kinase
MTQRDKAIYLDIDVKTLRNWKKHKPNLYKIVMLGFAFEEAVKQSKKNYEQLVELQKEILQEK